MNQRAELEVEVKIGYEGGRREDSERERGCR